MYLESFLNEGLYDEIRASEQKHRQTVSTGPTAAGLTNTDRLERQVQKLRLVCRALCEILIETTALTEEDLLDRIDEIDLRDGSRDGQMKAAPVKCRKCGRHAGNGKARCQYCGEVVVSDSGLDSKI